MEERYCQSCAMPMANAEMYGTEKNGEKSKDYCNYCYEKGTFTSECTMAEMMKICEPHMATPESGMNLEEARAMMKAHFPQLKRWKK